MGRPEQSVAQVNPTAQALWPALPNDIVDGPSQSRRLPEPRKLCWPSRPYYPRRPLVELAELAEQSQDSLWDLVGLTKHCGTSLLKDLALGEVDHFLSHVSVTNT